VPAEFSALKADVIEGVGGGGVGAQLAVDNSTGPTKGDIYLAEGTQVEIYAASGALLGKLDSESEKAAGHPWGQPCGVAVSSSGDLYVGFYRGSINRYVPHGDPVKSEDYTSTIAEQGVRCSLAAGPEGGVYAQTSTQPGVQFGVPVVQYEASQFGQPSPHGHEITGGAIDIAVDPSTNTLYVNELQGQILPFDSAGDAEREFGGEGPEPFGSYAGLTVNGTKNRVYAADPGRSRVDIFDPTVVADVTTDNQSNLQSTSVTLNGSVNPDEIALTDCKFEYGDQILNGGELRFEYVIPCSSTPGPGNTPAPVSANLNELVPNTQYFYRLVATDPNGVSQGPTVLFTTPAVLPTDVDQPSTASGITRSGAVLSGVVNPKHSHTTWYFAYGTTSNYGSTTVPASAGSEVADIPVEASLEALRPGTTYHYALVASNLAGTVTGPDETFTTAPALPPGLSGLTVGNLAPAAATISAIVESNGLPTTYEIDFGTDTNYATRAPGQIAGTAQTVSLNLLYLRPSTTYHYRVTASNEDGTVTSPDQTFTTPAYQLELPAVLPQIATPAIAFPANPQVSGGSKVKGKGKGRSKAKKRRKHKPAGRTRTAGSG
jgi:hypothetical protein